MYIAYRWISRDLGKGELVIAIILIGLVLGVLVDRSLQLFASAERRLVEASVTNMQTALQLQVAIQSLADNPAKIQISDGMNPVILVQSLPDDYGQYVDSDLAQVRARQFAIRPLTNYLGEFYEPDMQLLEKGNWYFDHKDKTLVYLIEHSEFFIDNESTVSALRYSVRLEYTDINKNRRYEPEIDRLDSASLIGIDT